MPLTMTVDQDLMRAMKAGDAIKVSTLRLIKAALINYRIEKKKENLEDADCLEVIQRQIKQRRDSIDSYEKAGRDDLAQKEKAELAILQAFQPKQLNDEEIKSLAIKTIADYGAKQKTELGKILKAIMPEIKGKADGKRVQEIVLSLLS